MFVSQLSSHHEQFSSEHGSMPAYETESTGAVKRLVTPDERLDEDVDEPPDYGPEVDDDLD